MRPASSSSSRTRPRSRRTVWLLGRSFDQLRGGHRELILGVGTKRPRINRRIRDHGGHLDIPATDRTAVSPHTFVEATTPDRPGRRV